MCVFLLLLLLIFTSTHQSSQHFCIEYILLQPLSNNNCLAFVFQQPRMNQSLRRAAPLFLSLSLCMCRFYLSLSSALLLFHPSFKSVSLVVKIVVGMILLSGAQHIFFNLLLLTHSLSPLPNPSSTTIFQPIPFFISHFKY